MDKILEALIEVRRQAKEGIVDHPCGICANLKELGIAGMRGYFIVNDNCKDWESFSGNKAYPIPSRRSGEFRWSGDQLTYRISLLDHLIAKAKDGTLVI